MKKNKGFGFFVSAVLTFSVAVGSLSLPALANENNGIFFKKTNFSPNNGIKNVSLNSLKTLKQNLSEPKKKLGTDLLKLIDSNFLLSNQTRAQAVSEMKGLKQFVTSGDSVATIDKRITNKTHNDLVYVYVNLQPTTPTSVINSIAWNVTDRDEKNHLAVAFVEVAKLEALASLNGVKSISSVLLPVTRSGSVVTEGDIIHQTDDVRSTYSQSGAGMKIGVISDGVDNIALSKSTGDLPAVVTVLDNSFGGDEGTAMLEIIHDMVPSAQLYFHSGFPNSIVFNNAVDDLVAAGVNVIVDDLGFFSQPFFEDGTIASHVASVLTANNIVFVSAAGNDALDHYQGSYFNDGSNFHDFSAGSQPTFKYLYADIPPGESLDIVLQWNDSFGSSSNDYDLFLFDMDGFGIIDSSEGGQNGNDIPFEVITYTNTTGSTIEAEIDVLKFSGNPSTLELFIFPSSGTLVYSDNKTIGDSIFGHPAVPGVIAVGAVAANDPGNDTIEPFSSQGPVTIISQGQRAKPDIIGIDRVTVTGVGGFGSPFPGTSAAAPHVAAIAAQLWGQHPSATSNQIRNRLLNSAIDLGTPGIDNIFGHGRADSLLSFQAGPTITSFNFTAPVATGVINEINKTITVTVPSGTDVTALVPTIVITGALVSPLSNVANNFSTPKTYTVTASDGLTKAYVVTVTVAPNPAKAITSFDFTTPAVTGVINETDHTIALTVPFGTDVTALVPTVVITGASVSPLNGVAQNFTSPVTYTVTAADSSTQAYVVTVTVSAAPVVTLSSIAITTPATKLSYTVGDTLDISGLVVTGTYSDASTQVETITTSNITGFDSSVPVVGQILTITFNEKTTTYTVDIIASSEPDTTAPVITLNGTNPTELTVGDPAYVDAGATASDNIDGDITANIVVGGDTVDVNTIGTYVITYNVSDAAGNPATQVTRTVNVIAAGPSDLTALTVAIASAQTLHDGATEGTIPGQYVVGSKAILQSAIDAAELLTSANTQAEVNTAVTVLATAVATFNSSIVGESDLTALSAAIASAQALHDGAVEGTAPGEYAVGSKVILQSAIDTASLITSAEDQSVVNSAITTLNDAVTVFNSGVVGDSDVSALNAAIASAQAIDLAAVAGTAPGQYPISAKNTFEAAIASAQTVNASSDQSIVDAAVVTLNEAISTFQATVIGPSDISALSAAIASAQTLHDGAVEGTIPGDYVIGSKAIYQTAINNASLLTTSDDQADIDNAIVTLASATTTFNASIVGASDLTALSAAITSAQALHDGAVEGTAPGEYVVGSKATLQLAIDAALLITSSENQSVINAAVVALNDAIAVFSAQRIVEISSESNGTTSTDSVTITWTTTHPATSRVIYDTVSHNPVTDPAPNYGYANSTVENATMVTNHSVTVSGLSSSTTYFFRPVSHGSPETYGDEISVATTAPQQNGGGGGGGGGGSRRTPPTTPAVLGAQIEVCAKPGDLFSMTTGLPCTATTLTTGQVLGVGSFNFTLLLKNGSQGNEVMELQKFLNTKLSLNLVADGKFGPKTKAGVVKFQTINGLVGDGIIGPITRAALNK